MSGGQENSGTSRLVNINLDERTVVRRSADVEHERAVAMFDLLEENHFALPGAWSIKPVAPNAVVRCFIEQQVLLIGTDRNTIREIESIRNNDRLASHSIEFEYAAVASMFENVEQACLV